MFWMSKNYDIMLMSVLIQGNLKIMYHYVEIVKQWVISHMSVMDPRTNTNVMSEIERK